MRDRYHLALRCQNCTGLHITRLYVLMNSQPICRTCLESARAERAAAAGLNYRGPDPDHPQYGHYRAPCGHDLRRQFEFIDRVALGKTGLRCETCFIHKEKEVAARLGWIRMASDPRGNPNYHMYRHRCGHTQRIARANLVWGQCDCAGCGETWTAKPSHLYLFDIECGDVHVLKLGYSAHPRKRQRHQLGLPREAHVSLLRNVAVPTGHTACVIEKLLHGQLRREFPNAVVPPEEYRGILNVISEVYRPWLAGELHRRLDVIQNALEVSAMANSGQSRPDRTPVNGAP